MATLLTPVEVDAEDPASMPPTKPIGPIGALAEIADLVLGNAGTHVLAV